MRNDRPKLSQNALAAALGVGPASVTKLKRQGMPIDSLEAAVDWRKRNLRQDLRTKQPPPTPDTSTLAQVTALALLAHDALKVGEFDLVAPKLRHVLRTLPPEKADQIAMPLDVWEALTARIANAVSGIQNFQPADLDEDQAAGMGAFWLAIASGNPAPPP